MQKIIDYRGLAISMRLYTLAKTGLLADSDVGEPVVTDLAFRQKTKLTYTTYDG